MSTRLKTSQYEPAPLQAQRSASQKHEISKIGQPDHMSSFEMKNVVRAIREFLRAQRRKMRKKVILPLRRKWQRQIPVAMITGTKGKTTTCRMLAHILRSSGLNIGLATSDGIHIGNAKIYSKTSSGYGEHAVVLNDKTINAAVLETARAGIRIHGLYIDNPRVGALLNVGREQIEMDGINSLEEMAALKSQVTDAAHGVRVLNGADPVIKSLIANYPTTNTIVFSMDPNDEAVRTHLDKGGISYCYEDHQKPKIVRRAANKAETVIFITDLPSSHNGILKHNIANAMAAAACAEGFGLSLDAVRAGLSTFYNSVEQSPGRFNVIENYPFKLIMDMADCPPAAEALLESLVKIPVGGHRICMLESVGNRPGWHYQEYTHILAQYFDIFVCYEQANCLRGRASGEISNLLRSNLMGAGIDAGSIQTATSYQAALKIVAAMAEAGDLVVVLGGPERDNIDVLREAFKRREMTPRSDSAIRQLQR